MDEAKLVANAIERVLAIGPLTTPEAWKAFEVTKHECIATLNPQASGVLQSFEIVPDLHWQGHSTLEPITFAPDEVTYLARDLWRWVEGAADPSRGTAIIAAACIEFDYSQFDSGLTGIAFARSSEVRDEVREAASAIPEMMLRRRWYDAEVIARNPEAADWFRQSAAADFHQWLYSTVPNEWPTVAYRAREPFVSITPAPNEGSLRHAMALVWLDEAMRDPSRAIELMSISAQIMCDGGFVWGWDAREELELSENSSFAKKGADARHAQNRERRKLVLAAFKAGAFASKDAAAERLGLQFGIPFRTVREYLKGDLGAA